MDRKTKGRVAEAKVLAYFVENDYEVYLPFADCGKVDLVVIKDGKCYRVSVKYTSEKENQKWRVRLSNTYRSTDGKVKNNLFDSSTVDLLAVYIGPEDRVVIREVDFSAKHALAVV